MNGGLEFSGELEFEWDEGNRDKNLLKHKVSAKECEESFLDEKKVIIPNEFHSKDENRFVIIGTTGKGRSLFIVFTLRNYKVRVISARDLNKKERSTYL